MNASMPSTPTLTSSKPALAASSFISGSALSAANVSDRRRRASGGVAFGTPMPRNAPSTQSTPSSLKVGTSGRSGWRVSIATASGRTLPLLAIANGVYVIAPSMWPPSTARARSPVPLYGTYVVLTPKSRFRRSCAAWLAELRPEPPRLSLPGFSFAALMKSAKVLIGPASLTTSRSGV